MSAVRAAMDEAREAGVGYACCSSPMVGSGRSPVLAALGVVVAAYLFVQRP